VMTREEAIAEAERGQASDPDASWIAASRGGEWTLVRIMERDTPRTHPFPGRRTKRGVRGRAVSAQASGDGRHRGGLG
jgi:hypothetical protein